MSEPAGRISQLVLNSGFSPLNARIYEANKEFFEQERFTKRIQGSRSTLDAINYYITTEMGGDAVTPQPRKRVR